MATPPPPGPYPPHASSPHFSGFPPGQPQYQQPPQGQRPAAFVCDVCGAQPAAQATVRGHEGMIIVMRFLKRSGSFCRTCGLATYRRMTSDTLLAGWWGIFSFFITPVVVLSNVLVARSRFRELPPPYGGWRPPLDPGKRLLRRLPVLLILTPIALVVLAFPALLVIGLVAGDDEPVRVSVGDCVQGHPEEPGQNIEAVGCDSGRAQYRVSGGDSCGPTDYLLSVDHWAEGQSGLCLSPVS
nr:hypothetical protein OH820_26780 [Streptomyces sp. NBC_00857]